MIQYYVPDIEVSHKLPSTESAHCIKVLRARTGDVIFCTNGRGTRYKCRITLPDREATGFEILSSEKIDKHWKQEITLAVASTKNPDRIEWLIEKAVEIGVDKFIVLTTDRTQPSRLKFDRIKRIAISAMNQSLKTKLPEVEQQSFTQFMSGTQQDGLKLICYCDDESERNSLINNYTGKEQAVSILIGPEGDFTPQEVEIALSKGFKCTTLGDTRLRTETAGLYSLAQIHTLSELYTTKANY